MVKEAAVTKTLIEIDDEYLAAAQQALGTTTKKDTTKKGTYTVTVGGRPRDDTITVVRDSTDSVVVDEHGRRRHHYSRRLPVTTRVLATAFRDPAARLLLARAREARMSQDSALLSYDATSYQRISAGMVSVSVSPDEPSAARSRTPMKWGR